MTQWNQKLTQRITSVVGIAAIASFASLPALAQMTRPGTHTSPGIEGSRNSDQNHISSLDREFVTHAFQSNNAEIATSQLALQRSEDNAIRQYAQRMINEHTQANEVLTRYASERNIELPDEPVDPLNRAIAEQLAQLSGRQFDQAYMDVQTNAHLRAFALFQTQSGYGQEPGLRSYASQLLPNIGEHYEMAREMNMGIRTGDTRPEQETQPVR